MKVLFLNPPNMDSQYINRDLMGGLGVNINSRTHLTGKIMSYLKAKSIRLPVLSLVYAASVLSRTHEVAALDAANLDLSCEETLRRIAREKPDWVISTTSISALMREAAFLADLKKNLNVTVGLMGDAATFLHAQVLEKYPIDFIIKGDEPEFVIDKIAGPNGYKATPGVIYREEGTLQDTGDAGTILNLDELPFPKWDLFPIKTYRYFPILRQTPFLPVLSTRGCPYGCIYCPYTSNQGLKYRFRSAENVIDELVYLREKYLVNAVQFRDPTFTLKKERILQICEGMLKHRLSLEWGCETRVDCLDEELIEKMAEAGLKGVNIGIESSDRDVVRNVKRGWIDPDHIQKMVRCMADHGIRVSGFFILGLPGENRKTIEKTLEFAVKLPLAYAEFKIATPFPGTPLFDMAKNNHWIEDVKIEDYTSYIPSMRVSEEMDPNTLQETANRAYHSFYMRPKKIIKEILSDAFISNLSNILIHG